jgi:hypothetical protein
MPSVGTVVLFSAGSVTISEFLDARIFQQGYQNSFKTEFRLWFGQWRFM